MRFVDPAGAISSSTTLYACIMSVNQLGLHELDENSALRRNIFYIISFRGLGNDEVRSQCTNQVFARLGSNYRGTRSIMHALEPHVYIK
jgi:hypothetical protein